MRKFLKSHVAENPWYNEMLANYILEVQLPVPTQHPTSWLLQIWNLNKQDPHISRSLQVRSQVCMENHHKSDPTTMIYLLIYT